MAKPASAQRVGKGPYRQDNISVPSPPRVSRLAAGSLALCLLSYGLLAIAWHDDTTWRFALPLALATFVAGAVMRAIASKRLTARDDLRGRSILRLHKYLLMITGVFVTPLLAFIVYVVFVVFTEGINFGRPLRIGGRQVLIRPCAKRAQRGGSKRSLYRWAAQRYWLQMAAMEHASVGAFHVLARQLRQLDATPELVARITEASEQENRHTALCLELASALGNTDWEPGAMTHVRHAEASVVELALEQLRDGCVGEAYAAALAAAGAQLARAEVADTLATIADDESTHAALSWDILQFLLRRGGSAVRHAVERESTRLAERAPRSRAPWMYAFDFSGEGMLPRGAERRTYQRLLATVRSRVAAMCAADAHEHNQPLPPGRWSPQDCSQPPVGGQTPSLAGNSFEG